jgi:hypothetical protein
MKRLTNQYYFVTVTLILIGQHIKSPFFYLSLYSEQELVIIELKG